MKNGIEDVSGEHVRTDKVMAELVERGVAFHHALGRTVATAYTKPLQTACTSTAAQ